MTNPTNPIIYLDDFARANFTPPISDWTPVVAAALASFDHNHDDTVHSVGGVIVFGPAPGAAPLTDGLYLFKTSARATAATPFGIEVNRTVILRGCGGGLPARTMLRFAPSLGGIRFNNGGYPLNADGSQSGLLTGQGSRVEDLCVQGNNGGARATAPNAHGIYASCGVTLFGVTVHAFSGHGIYFHGNPGDVPGTGCDFSRVDGCWAVFNLGDGCHIEGHDANGCLVLQSSFTSNTGYGVYDNSLTGAVILGSQFESQATDIWANQGSATTTCLGVYKESHGARGATPIEQVTINGNAVVVGNVLASDLLNSAGVFTSDSAGGVPSVLSACGQMSRVSVKSQDGTGVVGLGSGTSGSPNILTLADNRENNGVWPFAFKSSRQRRRLCRLRFDGLPAVWVYQLALYEGQRLPGRRLCHPRLQNRRSRHRLPSRR